MSPCQLEPLPDDDELPLACKGWAKRRSAELALVDLDVRCTDNVCSRDADSCGEEEIDQRYVLYRPAQLLPLTV
jgi:hypothetical protein